jgi:hypothetical protein
MRQRYPRAIVFSALLILNFLIAPPAMAQIKFISCGQTIHAEYDCFDNEFFFSGIAGQRVDFSLSSAEATSRIRLRDPDEDVVAQTNYTAFPSLSHVIGETSPNWSIRAELSGGCIPDGAPFALTMQCNAVPAVCVQSGSELELAAGRFVITGTFQTANGQTGAAQAVSMSSNSGYLWFFSPTNAELLVKVINGCAGFGKYWFFAAGLTNVGVNLTVTDLQSGQSKSYGNPVGKQFEPILDTNAFATCP